MPRWNSYRHVGSTLQSAPPLIASVDRVASTVKHYTLVVGSLSTWIVSYVITFRNIHGLLMT